MPVLFDVTDPILQVSQTLWGVPSERGGRAERHEGETLTEGDNTSWFLPSLQPDVCVLTCTAS